MPNPTRCDWCGSDPIYIDYHDREWGVPVHDDRTLFEFLILEGAQAGLNWLTILKKRAAYRRAFANFDMESVAGFGPETLEALRSDAGIVRNRLKIAAAVKNAHAALAICAEHGSLDAFLWAFVDGHPIVHRWRTLAEVPTTTAPAEAMSKALRKRGMTFVGPTICYAFMQAVGMVNDHLVACHRHADLA